MSTTISTKQKIIATSLVLIREKGYDLVTIKEICEACGISKHTFYYYFKSKEEILNAFFTLKREIKTECLEDILSAENNFEMYWHLLEPTIDFLAESGVEIVKQIFISNLSKNIGTFSSHYKKNKDNIHKVECSIIQKSQLLGEIHNMSLPNELAESNFNLNIGICVIWCMKNGSFDLKNACRHSTEVFFDLKKELRKAKNETMYK